MNRKPIGFLLATSMVFGFQSMALAEGEAIKTIATIVSELKHFPSDGAKQSLATIAKSSSASAGEKALAQAVLNFKHSAADSDKQALSKIAGDSNESTQVRELAMIVSGMSHMPNPTEVEKLKGMK